jgi:hypothetical protein
MRRFFSPVAIAVILTNVFISQTKATTTDNGKLVFKGTVSSIDISTLPMSMANYVVTMQVNCIVKGEFKGKTFQFRIQSPSMSGLIVGKQYLVEAKRSKNGYTVDQYQWIVKQKKSP